MIKFNKLAYPLIKFKKPLLYGPYTIQFNFTIKKKSSKIWMNEHVNDAYVKKAKLHNYRSRAAFKLIEINQRYNILKPGQKVIDLGSAPGGWTQVAVEKVNSISSKPLVLAIDKDHMVIVPGAVFFKGDIEDELTRIKIKEFFNMEPVDIILSDMAPNFTGDKDIDHIGISVLNAMALKVAMFNLKIGGTLLMKTLQGSAEKTFFMKYKAYFKNFQRIKPSASRSRSSEMFYLGTGFKLNENYIKAQRVKEKLEKGITDIDKNELPEYGMDFEKFDEFYERALRDAHKDNFPNFDPDTIKIAKENYNLDLKAKPDEEYDIETEKIKAFKDAPNNLSFKKPIPSTIKDMIKYVEEKEKRLQERMAIQKGNADEDTGLLLSEDEEEKKSDIQFDQMDSLADIDELSEEEFDPVDPQDKTHVKDQSMELKAQIMKEKAELYKDLSVESPEYLKKKMKEEFNEIFESQEKIEYEETFQEDLNEAIKRHGLTENKEIKERMHIMNRKYQEFGKYKARKDSAAQLWEDTLDNKGNLYK